jgi:hypothetical protein
MKDCMPAPKIPTSLPSPQIGALVIQITTHFGNKQPFYIIPWPVNFNMTCMTAFLLTTIGHRMYAGKRVVGGGG